MASPGWLTGLMLALLLGAWSAFGAGMLRGMRADTPRTWIVDCQQRRPWHFATITDALDSSAVQPGDTLAVRKGVYVERVNAKGSGLRIKSEYPGPANRPTIQRPSGLKPGAMTVVLNGGSFENFEVRTAPVSQRTGKAIGVTGQTLVTDCLVRGHHVGLVGWCASNFGQDHPSTFYRCEARDNDVGVCVGETEVIVAYCHLHDNGVGFQHAGGSCARVFSNLIEGNQGHGMTMVSYWAWAAYAEISNNTICRNGGDAVHLTHLGWQPHYPAGVRVQVQEPEWLPDMPLCPLIRDNIVFGNDGFGIYCENLNPTPPRAVQQGQTESTYQCVPDLRNNNVYQAFGRQYANCPDPVNPYYFDPAYDAAWYLPPDSPGVDAGSVLLHPGATRPEAADVGMLDVGYHHPADLLTPPHTILVDADGGGDYLTIQEAVNAAGSQDVIHVMPGVYQGPVMVPADKGDLVIASHEAGAGARPTVEVGQVDFGVELHFTGTFRNFRITAGPDYVNEAAGVLVTGACRLEACEIDAMSTGVVVAGPGSPQLAYNHFHDLDVDALVLGNGSAAQVFSNWFEGNAVAVRLHSSDLAPGFAVVANNTIMGNGDGVYLVHAAGDQPLCPVIRDNVVAENSRGVVGSTPYGPQGGIYPQLRYNNVTANPPHPGTPQNYVNCPTPAGSSRVIMPLWHDPGYQGTDTPDYLGAGSLNLDAGSLTLKPGQTTTAWGFPVPDTGTVDLGYHHAPAGACAWH